MAFSALGYDSAPHGHNQWNGVAILSRVGIEDVTTGFDDETVDPYEGDARLVAATCGGVKVVSVYVPNGREVGTEFYDRKLVWLDTLHDWVAKQYSPDDQLVVAGDFNVAPEDRDLWSVKAFEGSTHVTEPERAAVRKLEDWGLVDAFRHEYQEDGLYSYWDYRRGDFHQHRGMRIDLVLVTQAARRPDHLGDHRPQRPQGEAALRPHPGRHRRRRLSPAALRPHGAAPVSGKCWTSTASGSRYRNRNER